MGVEELLKLTAEEERERCAQICEGVDILSITNDYDTIEVNIERIAERVVDLCAAAIRGTK